MTKMKKAHRKIDSERDKEKREWIEANNYTKAVSDGTTGVFQNCAQSLHLQF